MSNYGFMAIYKGRISVLMEASTECGLDLRPFLCGGLYIRLHPIWGVF